MSSAVLIATALVNMLARAQEAIRELELAEAGKKNAHSETVMERHEVFIHNNSTSDLSSVGEATLTRGAISDAIVQMMGTSWLGCLGFKLGGALRGNVGVGCLEHTNVPRVWG